MNFKPLSEIPARPPSSLAGGEKSIAKKIVDAAFTVHKKLGPGLLEKVYSPRWIVVFYEMYFSNGVITIFEKMFKLILNCIQRGEICFWHELSKRGLKYQRQVDIPIVYDGIVFDEGLHLDVLVEKLVICEILRGVPSGKAVNEINPVWEARILSHLKLTNKRLGFLINFNVPLIKDGIKRIIL